MWCVAELDEEYIRKMEDVLAVYEKPYDASPSRWSVWTKNRSRFTPTYDRPKPPARGKIAKRDNEYERCGTANVFCAVEPKAGRHFTKPTPTRSAAEFAQVIAHLAVSYPDAQHDSSGDGQPEHPLPEVSHRLLRGPGR